MLAGLGIAFALATTGCSVSTSDGSGSRPVSSVQRPDSSTVTPPIRSTPPHTPSDPGPHSTVPHNTLPHNTPPHNTVPAPGSADPSAPNPGPGTSPHGRDGKVSKTAAKANLDHLLRSDEDDCMVELPGGFEAVMFDTTGHLRFLSSVDGAHWHQDQTSTYRYDPRDAKGQRVSAHGALLTGMKNATFILRGTFSGDGTGLFMAYTYGPSGWGPVIRAGAPAKRDGTRLTVAAKLPGEYSDSQVAYHDLEFSHGYLVVKDCDAAHRGATCGAAGTLITSWWLWDSGEQDFRSAQ